MTEDEVREIRTGLVEGVRGPIALKWVEQLLQDRDERVRRDREIAVRLLAASPAIDMSSEQHQQSRTALFGSHTRHRLRSDRRQAS